MWEAPPPAWDPSAPAVCQYEKRERPSMLELAREPFLPLPHSPLHPHRSGWTWWRRVLVGASCDDFVSSCVENERGARRLSSWIVGCSCMAFLLWVSNLSWCFIPWETASILKFGAMIFLLKLSSGMYAVVPSDASEELGLVIFACYGCPNYKQTLKCKYLQFETFVLSPCLLT